MLFNILLLVVLAVVFILRKDILRLAVMFFSSQMLYYAWCMTKLVEKMIDTLEKSLEMLKEHVQKEDVTSDFNEKLQIFDGHLRQTNANFRDLDELFHQVPGNNVFRKILQKRIENFRLRLERLNESTLWIAE
ncbi:hypothetical protein A2914_02000 [Candidatus Nomurabacteria bacterium RIFCSPLOWO2_01_FULL_41_21]|uniref:Uncharacterized protein n=1 Tax=Candidatus Nomurabacteria bacterium RIFCSPLOWO2_01_FULL_41_21 TaxID=1801776 RepID=A0A1F6X3S3_9BACT|nr:MAG: hypothetical protein A2914_02000 [Candidatus Nomurabacteria bacterium RIFCSPLOWO2_01_FULL_41_21]